MSNRVINSITTATPFNTRNVPVLLGGRRSLSERLRHTDVMKGCEDLVDRDCGSDLFARAVARLQANLGFSTHHQDAKFGRQTYLALLKHADPISENYITIEGRRHLVVPQGWRMVCFDEDGGLDLHRRGHFGNRKKTPIEAIVMHWGGLNPKHLYNVAMSPSRRVSTHFGIGKDDDGVVTVYQYLDLVHSAWHAGKINTRSVGVDICQQADTRWKEYYQGKGIYDVKEIDNPTRRGNARILSIDPEIKWATRDFVGQLMQILHDEYEGFDAGKEIPDADSLLTEGGTSKHSLLGHHHLRKSKWDIACWWDELFQP